MYNEKFDNVDLVSEIPIEVHQLPYGYSTGVLYFQFEKKPLVLGDSFKDRLGNFFPVFIMFVIIITQTRAYVFWYILPTLETKGNLEFWPVLDSRHLCQLYLFVLFSAVFLCSTVLTLFTQPGDVDEELSLDAENLRADIFQVSIGETFLDKIQRLGNSERKRTLFPRFCRSCLKVKPDRSHHCSVCNKCVLKMDHHCPYVNNCIGLMNYKYFMNMILSALACCTLISGTMWEEVHKVWGSFEYEISFQVLIGVSYFGGLVLNIVLIAFCMFHFYLIFFGLTTIELREKLTVKFETSPYDRGFFNNFADVFGTNPLFWFIPVSNFYLGPAKEKMFTFDKNEAI